MLERAVARKQYILSQPRQDRNFDELQWSSRDIEAMLSPDQFQKHLLYKQFQKWNIGKKLKQLLFKEEGDKAETSRKRQIRYDKPGKFRQSYVFRKWDTDN